MPRVVVVKERNPACPDKYSHEQATYRQLKAQQGINIPRLYGEATVLDGAEEFPALLLEFIDGTPAHRLPLEDLASEATLQALRDGRRPLDRLGHLDILYLELAIALQNLLGEFEKADVVHGDPNLDNFILCSRNGFFSVTAVDLESAQPPGIITRETDFQSLLCSLTDKINFESNNPALIEW